VVFLRNLAFRQEEVVAYCETDRDAIEAPGGRLTRPRQRELLRAVSAEYVSNLAAAQAGLKASRPSR